MRVTLYTGESIAYLKLLIDGNELELGLEEYWVRLGERESTPEIVAQYPSIRNLVLPTMNFFQNDSFEWMRQNNSKKYSERYIAEPHTLSTSALADPNTLSFHSSQPLTQISKQLPLEIDVSVLDLFKNTHLFLQS